MLLTVTVRLVPGASCTWVLGSSLSGAVASAALSSSADPLAPAAASGLSAAVAMVVGRAKSCLRLSRLNPFCLILSAANMPAADARL
jgi:hypothetical protein